MDAIGDYKLAADVIDKFADFNGLTERECERLRITGEAGQVLRAVISDGIVSNREQKQLQDYFTKGFVNNLAWDHNRRPVMALGQNLRYILEPLKLSGWPTELPSGSALVEFVHGTKGLRTRMSHWVPDLVSIAVYDEDWLSRDRAIQALVMIGPSVLPKLFETSVTVMSSKDYDDDNKLFPRRYWHLVNLGEVYWKLGEASATFLLGKLELGDPSEQTVAARALGSVDSNQAPFMVPRMIHVFQRPETTFETKYQLFVAFDYIGDPQALDVVEKEVRFMHGAQLKEDATISKEKWEEYKEFYLKRAIKTYRTLKKKEK